MKISKHLVFALIGLLLFGSCGSNKSQSFRKWKSESFRGNGVLDGVLVIDAKRQDTLIAENAQKLFIPASTTKILSLYAGLEFLPNEIPALKYRFLVDRTEVLPTGDPTQLHPYFKDSTSLRFLSSVGPVTLDLSRIESTPWGPGWAWEDYPYYFSPDRSAFPLYGNVLQVYQKDSITVISPSLLASSAIWTHKNQSSRDRFKNSYSLSQKAKTDTLLIPFISSDSLTFNLLENIKGISIINGKIQDSLSTETYPFQVLPGLVADSVYKYMMSESDNFLAEQIMLMASSTLGDTLSFVRARDSIISKKLPFLKGKSRWVDGSGLSRYNLQSPYNLVGTLDRIQTEYPASRLKTLFPAYSFESVKLNTWELKSSSADSASVFAKSGFVGNNYSLAGYLFTKKGRLFIFAIMQNHFLQPAAEIRRRVAGLLYSIYQAY